MSPHGISSLPATTEYIDARIVNMGTSTTGTIPTLNFGADGAGRRIFLPFSLTGAALLSSLTVGGVLATIHLQKMRPASGYIAGLASVLLPTGASGSVGITLASAPTAAAFAVLSHRVMNLKSVTPFHTASTEFTSQTSTSLNLNVKKDGVAFWCSHYLSGSNFGMTNMIERAEYAYFGGTQKLLGADLEVTANETGRLLTQFRNSGSLTMSGAAVAASFR
jgi:hypothetical protein